MENQNRRSLSNIINEGMLTSSGTNQETTTVTQTRSYNTFLTLYSINLVHRFPDITDLTTIDSSVVRRIAEFCAASAVVGWEVWEDLGSRQSKQMLRPQSRTA